MTRPELTDERIELAKRWGITELKAPQDSVRRQVAETVVALAEDCIEFIEQSVQRPLELLNQLRLRVEGIEQARAPVEFAAEQPSGVQPVLGGGAVLGPTEPCRRCRGTGRQSMDLVEVQADGSFIPDPLPPVAPDEVRVDRGDERFTLVVPQPMPLQCPECGCWHVDGGVWATRMHKRHQCQHCKHEWRPHDFATVGIAPDSIAIPPVFAITKVAPPEPRTPEELVRMVPRYEGGSSR